MGGTAEFEWRRVIKLARSSLAGLLAVFVSAGGTRGAEPDPLPVVQALVEAQRVANLDAAIALFADDAFILNVMGFKTADRNQLKWFISTEIWLRDDFRLANPRVDGHRVSWTEAATAPFYKSIGVAPVQFAFEATIQGAKITSIVAHLPVGEIARIREACKVQPSEPLINVMPCSEFVQLVEAHTRGSSRAARAPPAQPN